MMGFKTAAEVIEKLKSMADPEAVKGMARFGINPDNNLGISIYKLRPLAKQIGGDHQLAMDLWASGIHDARILASYIDLPGRVTEDQMEKWVADFDSWDVCDQVCSNLFDQTAWAYRKAFEWSEREEEFIKRAGFVLMASLSVHDKQAEDEKFEAFFPVIEREAHDGRNYVKKAVNWALRQIGKRNSHLNKKAIEVAEKIGRMDSKPARWIAADALRELTSDKVAKRLAKKK